MKHLIIMVMAAPCAACAMFNPPAMVMKLERGHTVCVAIPDDGTLLWLKKYPETGLATAQMFQEALLPYATDVFLEQADEKRLLASAKNAHAKYLIIPKITSWEKIRFWFIRRSGVSLRVTIYDVSSGKPIMRDRILVQNMDKFNTPHPQEMIDYAVRSFVISLY